MVNVRLLRLCEFMASKSSIAFNSSADRTVVFFSELDFRNGFSESVISKYSVEPVVFFFKKC